MTTPEKRGGTVEPEGAPGEPSNHARTWIQSFEATVAVVVGTLETRALLRRMLLFALFCGCAALYLRPIFRHLHALGIQDWDVHLAYRAVIRRTILEYHQFPLWTPYHSGGLPFLANPQTSTLSPSTLFVLATDAVVGVKLEIYFHYVVGLCGAYACARSYTIDRLGSLMAALIYMCSGMLAMSQCTGMTTFLSAAYIPWILFSLRRAGADRRFAAGAGVLFALMLFQGGIHLAVLAWVSFVLLGLAEFLLVKAHPRRFLADLSIASAVALGVGAVKAFPILELMRRLPRVENEYSGFSLQSLVHSLLGPDQSVVSSPIPDTQGFFRGMSWGVDENAQYVGVAALVLVVAGLAVKGRRALPVTITFGVLVWLSLGDRPPVSLWSLLHRLPVFSAMRVAQRFRFVWMLFFALFAGMGLQAVRERLTTKMRSKAITGIVALGILTIVFINLMTNASAYETGLSLPTPELKGSGAFRQMWKLPMYDASGWESWKDGPKPLNAWSGLYPAIMQNSGTILAYEPIADGLQSRVLAAGDTEYRGEVYVMGGSGTVTMADWSPNRLVVDVDAHDDVSVVFNQNYFPGWHSSAGAVVDSGGLLSVPMVRGRNRVTLWYRPTSFVIGAWTSLLSLLGVAVIAIRGKRSPAA